MKSIYKILIVDDDKTLLGIECAFVKKYMKQHNLNFTINRKTESFPALFELCDNGETYDLIILDYQMPHMNGDEIFQSLTPLNANFLERIVFITASPDSIDERFPEYNYNVITKPFSYKEFKKIADKVLNLTSQNENVVYS